MRKLACLVALLCFAVPASAGDITFTASSSADGQITIGYSATSASDVPVGIGIKVEVSGGCAGTVSGGANVVSASSEFDVEIDYAHDLGDPNTYTIGSGHPLADPCEAGVPDPCVSEFSICMGRLDPCTPASQSIANLVTLQLDCSLGCGAGTVLNVDIEADNLRGGIVGAAFGSVNMVDGTVNCVGTVGPSPPPCWLYDAQCHGDLNNSGAVDTADWPIFRDSFGRAYPHAEYNPCGDTNQDGEVSTADWPDFRDYFGAPAVGGCQALAHIPGDWPP